MKCKFSLLLFLCVLSLWGQAQSLNLQELVNKKQFQEVVARADSLTPADSADYATMSESGRRMRDCCAIRRPISVFLIA